MSRRARLAALLAPALLIALVLPASVSATHSWGGYHWARTSNPFTVKLGDDLSLKWKPYLATASSDWSQSTVLDTTVVTGQASNKRCRPTTGRVEVCDASYGQNGWLGVASINVSGKHITAGSVKLNDTYFAMAAYDTPAWRQLVVCQEVGHTFGLDHQDEVFTNPNLGTCMDYTNDPSTNQHPNQHDYDELVTIYSHLDSTTTVSAAPASAAAAAGRAGVDSSWGRLVATTGHGQGAWFIRDLGAGRAVLTHVLWAR